MIDLQVSKNAQEAHLSLPESTADNDKKVVKFDSLKMYFGEPYEVPGTDSKLQIFQPKIGDILEIGEEDFYSNLSIFVSNPTSYRLALWDAGEDWNNITEFQLFLMLFSRIDPFCSKMLFGDVDITDFDWYEKQLPEKEKEIVLIHNKLDFEINADNFMFMQEYLRTMFNIHPKVEKAKGRTTKEWMIEEDRISLFNKSKQEKTTSTLLPLISSCTNHPGFKYKLEEVKQMGIVQFMDSVQRLQIYESTVALNHGIYSGMVSTKDIDKKNFNFMREIQE